MITATDSGSGGGMNSSRYLSVYVFFLVTFTPGCCASYSACWRFWRSRSSSCCQHRHQQALWTQCIGVDPDPIHPNCDGNIDVNVHPKFLPVVCTCAYDIVIKCYNCLLQSSTRPILSHYYWISTWARTPITKLTKDRTTTDPLIQWQDDQSD